jgi:hypothetical protein
VKFGRFRELKKKKEREEKRGYNPEKLKLVLFRFRAAGNPGISRQSHGTAPKKKKKKKKAQDKKKKALNRDNIPRTGNCKARGLLLAFLATATNVTDVQYHGRGVRRRKRKTQQKILGVIFAVPEKTARDIPGMITTRLAISLRLQIM